jgi:hypothetical protein
MERTKQDLLQNAHCVVIDTPPNHRDGVVHHTRVEAEADNEHVDGKTTEQGELSPRLAQSPHLTRRVPRWH